jgi:hypothetical protein
MRCGAGVGEGVQQISGETNSRSRCDVEDAKGERPETKLSTSRRGGAERDGSGDGGGGGGESGVAR